MSTDQETTPTRKVRAADHESHGTMTLIAVLIPLAGLIVGIAYLTKDRAVDRKLGEHLLSVSILAGIVEGFLWMMFLMFMGNA